MLVQSMRPRSRRPTLAAADLQLEARRATTTTTRRPRRPPLVIYCETSERPSVAIYIAWATGCRVAAARCSPFAGQRSSCAPSCARLCDLCARALAAYRPARISLDAVISRGAMANFGGGGGATFAAGKHLAANNVSREPRSRANGRLLFPNLCDFSSPRRELLHLAMMLLLLL